MGYHTRMDDWIVWKAEERVAGSILLLFSFVSNSCSGAFGVKDVKQNTSHSINPRIT